MRQNFINGTKKKKANKMDLIDNFKKRFFYENGELNWKPHCRNFGKKVGYANKDGYIEVNMNFGFKENRKFLAHRIIFALAHGHLPDLVDHIDQNPKNNCIDNLRSASKFTNAVNTGIPANNSSEVKGVCICKRTGKYTAQIQKSQKKIHLGRFKTLEEAKNARLNAEKIYWP